jgi:hypothetical protein
MKQEPENVIFSYTDMEALMDGVLVSVKMPPVNRVTRAVFDDFAEDLGGPNNPGMQWDLGPLHCAITAILAARADSDGWRSGSYQGKKLWLVPNEVGGLTLMFPEDY